MTHMPGLLQWKTINSSEETGKEGEAALYVRGCLDCLELSDEMTQLKVMLKELREAS